MAAATPAAAIRRAQHALRRASIRRELESVVLGKKEAIALDLEHGSADAASIMEELTRGHGMASTPVRRLVVAFKNSGHADAVIEMLAAKSPQQRAHGARLVGALQMYEAVPWLAVLLESKDRTVVGAAARAIGRIGGTKSASAIVSAIQRRGLNRRLVAELARCAPDLFIESALGEPQRPSVRPALAMAAGLRRRHAAVGPLIGLLERGSRRERVIGCRALGWIGSGTAIPPLKAALQDRDWKIRMSAAKALGALRARSAKDELKFLQTDLNARVRAAGRNALNRIEGRA
jgi:HEAT repeat protein